MAAESIKKNLPGKQQTTIPLEVLIDYRAKNLTYREIGRLTNRSAQDIHERLQNEEIETLGIFKNNKDKVFEHLQRKILNTLDITDIKKMQPGTKITAIAILQDKIRDIRGQNDSNIKPLVHITIQGQAAVQVVLPVDNPVDNFSSNNIKEIEAK